MEKFKNLSRTKRVFAIIGMAIGGVFIAVAMAFIFGFAVMWLWNWLMPEIFGLTTITFWQAWGLVVLTHILFKSFPHHSKHIHDDHWKNHFKEKFCQEHRTSTSQENSEPVTE